MLEVLVETSDSRFELVAVSSLPVMFEESRMIERLESGSILPAAVMICGDLEFRVAMFTMVNSGTLPS